MNKAIGILGDIGSGKSFIAKQFGYPVFNADKEVIKIYKDNKSCFKKLRNKLPKYIKSYPLNKLELSKAILANKHNLKKIVSVSIVKYADISFKFFIEIFSSKYNHHPTNKKPHECGLFKCLFNCSPIKN